MIDRRFFDAFYANGIEAYHTGGHTPGFISRIHINKKAGLSAGNSLVIHDFKSSRLTCRRSGAT
jgi:hypothetical protein